MHLGCNEYICFNIYSKLQQYLSQLNENDEEEDGDGLNMGSPGFSHVPSWDVFNRGENQEEEEEVLEEEDDEEEDEEEGGTGMLTSRHEEEEEEDALSGDELNISALE